jgi:hypothetical protein
MANINRILSDANIGLVDWRHSKRCWEAFRVANGWGPKAPLLTPPGANLKLDKDHNVVTYGLALAQANTVGLVTVRVWSTSGRAPLWCGARTYRLVAMHINTCPFSTPACRHGCVSQNGNGRYDKVQQARQLKTRFLLEHPDEFCSLLAHELDIAYRKHGDRLRVRLNTFSDIRWEEVAPWLLRGDVTFYDYTKDWSRVAPANYRLTLSASERTSDRRVLAAVGEGRSVAVVFDTPRTRALPETWHGLRVIDGDKTDDRYGDLGLVVGLRAKGKMRGDDTGMVRRTA